MYPYIKVVVMSAALAVPFAVFGQDHDHADKNDKPTQHYEDRAHKDSHEWNANEDKSYRRYLTEHHQKYHEFAKAKQRDQDNYWTWRHTHPDEDRR